MNVFSCLHENSRRLQLTRDKVSDLFNKDHNNLKEDEQISKQVADFSYNGERAKIEQVVISKY